jgi:hypothetical protein
MQLKKEASKPRGRPKKEAEIPGLYYVGKGWGSGKRQ